jgi:RNA polymerase sigma-70 factor (ECF subfamily)
VGEVVNSQKTPGLASKTSGKSALSFQEQYVNGPDADPLLPGLAAGEEGAFAALYDRFAGRMFRTAFRMLGSREDAEDVVQDVFLAAVRSRQRLADVQDLTAYLFTALHRAAGRFAQRRKGLQPWPAATDEAAAPVERVASDNSQWERLQQAIRSLPDEQREVVTLKIDGELTFAQIAEVVGVGVSTAASRYQYALKKLKASLITVRNTGERRTEITFSLFGERHRAGATAPDSQKPDGSRDGRST